MSTSTISDAGLLQTLAAGFNKASLAKRHRNVLPGIVTRDFSPAVADFFSVINTNIMASSYSATNLPQGGGTEATPVNMTINPGAVTLDQHPTIVLDLPNMDTTLAGSSYIAKVVDELEKTISNKINAYIAAQLTPAKLGAGAGGYNPIYCPNFPEVSAFSGGAVSTTKNITSAAFMAGWKALAANQIPVGDIGNFHLTMPSEVYGNVLLNPNMYAANLVGPEIAASVSATAKFSSRFGCIFDWDPDLNSSSVNSTSGGELALLSHRYFAALVSRAVAPPRSASVPCTYVEIFPGENGEPGITVRLVVDFWAPAAADRLLADVLFGFAVTRPDHAILMQVE
jgi:hypothetical protein